MHDQIEEAAEYLRRHLPGVPDTAIILGSGLGEFADTLEQKSAIATQDVPHYPLPTVPGHGGRLVAGRVAGTQVLVLQGRVHYYESGDLGSVLFPIRVLHALGTRTLLLTNAAGGINPQLEPGDLMVITGQLDMTGLRLPGALQRGLHEPYNSALADLLVSVAEESSIPLKKGVYAGVKGPSYETASEIRMVRMSGGDAVGMSTVLEAAEGSHLGMRVAGISCITNKSTGLGPGRLDHREVTEVADRVKGVLVKLLSAFVAALARTSG